MDASAPVQLDHGIRSRTLRDAGLRAIERGDLGVAKQCLIELGHSGLDLDFRTLSTAYLAAAAI